MEINYVTTNNLILQHVYNVANGKYYLYTGL